MESENGKLFVGGVSQDTNEDILKLHFNKYGEVKKSEVIKNRATGQGRGFGFVTFTDPSVVDRALQDPHKINGKTVEVKVARPRSERHQQKNNGSNVIGCNGNCNPQFKTKKIFVGGLPLSLTKEEFKRYFERFGTIADVVVMHDKENSRPRGFGFITFDSEEAVDNVLQKSFHELNNKLVEVKRAEPKDRSNRHMCTYDTHNNGLGFGGWSTFGGFGFYPPYASCCSNCAAGSLPYGTVSGNYYGVNPYGVGALTRAYNGVGYETISDVAACYRSPISYGSPVFYPTYANVGTCVNGWANGLVDVKGGDGNYQGPAISLINDNLYENDDGGDAEIPVSTSPRQSADRLSLECNDTENQKGAGCHSSPCNSSHEGAEMPIFSEKSSENLDGGDAEVPVSTSLPQIVDELRLDSNSAENQKGAYGHTL